MSKRNECVKGVSFVDHRDAGDPVVLAAYYNDSGADELVFYDITASSDERNIMVDVVERTAAQVFIPLTVGGGIRTVDDMYRMLRAGADKISINTAAVLNPQLISDGAKRFGSQCIVLSIDVRRVPDNDGTHSGRYLPIQAPTPALLASMPCNGQSAAPNSGASELVINSMDADGTYGGYDIALLHTISSQVRHPRDCLRRCWHSRSPL
jgi:cyclase